MNTRTIYLQKMADAALVAIEQHWLAGIGTRPVSSWDVRDVINESMLRDALAIYGLDIDEANEAQIESIVSPIVFREWYASSGYIHERLQRAMSMLHLGGINTCELTRMKVKYSPKVETTPITPLDLTLRHLFSLTRA